MNERAHMISGGEVDNSTGEQQTAIEDRTVIWRELMPLSRQVNELIAKVAKIEQDARTVGFEADLIMHLWKHLCERVDTLDGKGTTTDEGALMRSAQPRRTGKESMTQPGNGARLLTFPARREEGA